MLDSVLNSIRSNEFSAIRRRPELSHVFITTTDIEALKEYLPVSVFMSSEYNLNLDDDYVCSSLMKLGYILRIHRFCDNAKEFAMSEAYGKACLKLDVEDEDISLTYPKIKHELARLLLSHIKSIIRSKKVLLPPPSPGKYIRSVLPVGLSGRTIATEAEIDPAHLSRVFNDQMSVTDSILLKLARTYGVDPEAVWLAEAHWKTYLSDCALRGVEPILPEKYKQPRPKK